MSQSALLRRLNATVFLLPLAAVLLSGCASFSPSANVRLNETQVIGTHNSYRLRTYDSLLRLIAQASPAAIQTLDYGHRPLPEQLSRFGIRQIEFDIYADPKGGLFAEPSGMKRAAEAGLAPVPKHDPTGQLQRPGFKVLHAPDVDYWSSVLTLVDGLRQVREWSAEHPAHFPILILLELKEDAYGSDSTKVHPYGEAELTALEAEILSVFPRKRILAPDDVRGKERTLPAALRKQGWPRLNSARGKVMFAMINETAVRDLYLQGHPVLEGRLLFVNVPTNHPAATWQKINDPVQDFAKIQSLVKAGFLVRTRADEDTLEARKNETFRRDQAMASGAQFISTDFPEPNLAFSPYFVRFDGGLVVRANPVNGSRRLNGLDLEKPPPANGATGP
jgi:hypothetical protein